MARSYNSWRSFPSPTNDLIYTALAEEINNVVTPLSFEIVTTTIDGDMILYLMCPLVEDQRFSGLDALLIILWRNTVKLCSRIDGRVERLTFVASGDPLLTQKFKETIDEFLRTYKDLS